MSQPVPHETVDLQSPWHISRMGTSGLRLTQEDYNRPLYLEQFTQGLADFFREIQAGDDTVSDGNAVLLGGDPRLGNRHRIDLIARILIANGFRVIVPLHGLASTPAMSHGIRKLGVLGGIILTASHNPYTDVGIKVNCADGSPVLDDGVERIQALQNSCVTVLVAPETVLDDADLVTEIDIVTIYADLLDSIFSFSSMRSLLLSRPVRAAFDCMHGAAGPFAREVFTERLGLDAFFLREEPREDLGGHDAHGEPMHPEPDFDYIPELIGLNLTGGYDLVAAWDSDVDRRLDGGTGFFIESADEFALFARYSSTIDIGSLFDETVFFCRSTVTADTIDRMEMMLPEEVPGKKAVVVETPTGFKWIAELGNWGVEESNGVGNPWLREKDGIFATVFLLKIMLKTGLSVQELVESIWHRHGRVYFTRGEITGTDPGDRELLTGIMNRAGTLAGSSYGTLTLEKAGSWDYRHPVTGSIDAGNAAWVLSFSGGNTVKARFSGTGSGGYTLRVYCSTYDTRYALSKSDVTRPMKDAFDRFLSENGFPGKAEKYTDTHQPDPYREE